jgi:hypothetical protein
MLGLRGLEHNLTHGVPVLRTLAYFVGFIARFAVAPEVLR